MSYIALQDDRLHDLAQIARETLDLKGDCWEVRNTIRKYIEYKYFKCIEFNLCKCSRDKYYSTKLFIVFSPKNPTRYNTPVT